MNRLTLILRNIRHHRRRHLGTALGAATATAILTASLIVGDSVRSSLQDLALRRLGHTDLAVESGDRRFRAAMAADLAPTLGRDTAALLAVAGSATAPDSELRAPQVSLVGVDAALDQFAEKAPGFGTLSDGEAFVNAPLAERLRLKPGDPLILRFALAGALPADVPMGNESDAWARQRVVVKAVLDDAQLGRYSLRATQAAPLTVFLPRTHLAARLDAPDRANVLLVATAPGARPTPEPAVANAALAKVRTLSDHELEIRVLTNSPAGGVELRSSRIFLDPGVVRAARGAAAESRVSFAYIVNSLRSGTNACPYSFVAGLEGTPLPDGTADDEIAIGAWLAADLGVAPGGSVTLEYFVLDPAQRLIETSRTFRVRAVLPLAGPAADPTLIPDFPGIRDAGRCGDWTPGIPLDLKRIRQKDEDYWSVHRGTPKAFVTLAAAQSMWSNRFGAATAVRWPASAVTPAPASAATAGRGRAASDGTSAPRPAVAATEDASPIAMASAILSHLPPSSAGLAFAPVRADGIRAGAGATDFAELFIGLGFFIVAAALILAGLLFGLALTARAPETGLLRAVGYRRGAIRAILLGEAALVAATAAMAGSAAGIAMADAILGGLRTVWHDAVGTTALALAVRTSTVVAGAAAGLLASLTAAFLVLRRQEFRPVHELQTAGADDASSPSARGPVVRLIAGGIALVAAAGMRLAMGGGAGPGVLLGAGALALAGGLLLYAGAVGRLASGRGARAPDPRVFGARNWTRRPRRSGAAILMPACGVFLVFAVGANRPTVSDPESRASGTGGFAFLGTTALPLARDPGTAEGRELYGLPAAKDGVRLLVLRRLGGDDASCLNLNRVDRPPLVGVPAGTFDGLGAFTFKKLAPGVDPARPWSCLSLDLGPGVLPVVVDESVALWSLKKKVGDRIDTVDERGRPIQLQITGLLADSVFQGNLLAADDAFLRAYPSATLQMMLVDAPPAHRDEVRRVLEDRLGDLGLDLPTTTARLDSFLAVQRTYLDIFLAFGAIGLLIGAAGFGVVANRNLIERRREFGLLHALGYPRRRLVRGAVAEHVALASLGLAIGALASLFAIPPSALAGSTLPGLALVLAGMALIATLTTALSARAVLRTPALEALKEE